MVVPSNFFFIRIAPFSPRVPVSRQRERRYYFSPLDPLFTAIQYHRSCLPRIQYHRSCLPRHPFPASMSCPSVPLENVEPLSRADPPPDDEELSHRRSFQRIGNLTPKELVDYHTAERFFCFFRESVKVRFSELMVPGTLFLSSCWHPDFNTDELGLPIGPAFRLSNMVVEIYMKAGTSLAFARSGTCH